MYYAFHRWSPGELYDVGFAKFRIIVATPFFNSKVKRYKQETFSNFWEQASLKAVVGKCQKGAFV